MSGENDGRDPEALSKRQHFEGLLKMLALVAPALSQALLGLPLLAQGVFGTLDERRANRIIATLKEVEERLRRVEGMTYVDTEEYQSLLESVIPQLARATHEDKRQRLRDLIFNTALLPPAHQDWGEAELAARVVSEIDGPGLAIVAAMGLLPGPYVTMWALPSPAMFSGLQKTTAAQGPGGLPRVALNFSFPALIEWVYRLQDLRICHGNRIDESGIANGAGAIVGWAGEVAPLGRLLIRWTLASE